MIIHLRKRQMNSTFTHGMASATELTRSGKLQEATALIQSLMRSTPQDLGPASSEADFVGETIEGQFTRLDPDASEQAAAPPVASSGAQSAQPRAARFDRAPLAETLRKISAGGMPVRGHATGAGETAPDGAEFVSGVYDAVEGRRRYRIYVPANRSGAPMPLIVMLHGCTQTPEDFAAGTGMNRLAEEFGCLIAYPAQPSEANAQKCWNWFRPEDQARDCGEPALIAGLTLAIQSGLQADPKRTYIAGLSAGGAAAVVVAAAYPEIFGAVGVHSGLPAGGARDIPSAFAAMRAGSAGQPHQSIVPTIVFHGLADHTVHPKNGTAVLLQAVHAMSGLRVTTRKGKGADGGHSFRTTSHLHKDGRSLAEHWEIEGAGHAWAGGCPAGSFTDPKGPSASREMMRFFLQHKKG